MTGRASAALFPLILVPAVISAQRVVRGVVRGPNGPLSSVNVFDVETLDGVITRESGAFSIVIRDTARTSIALAARRVGFKPVNTIVPVGDSVEIVMEPLAALSPVNVLAGRFTAGTERSSALTPLEVMTTPGGGDVNAAVKTLPGVQTVDEGSGLFVRGGDYTETRTFIDGAPMFSAYQLETPTGSVAGTINPFLTDGITFSAGGFGAQWGNALSGIVDLHPLGRPQSTSASVNATLLSVGAGMQLRLDHGLGFSATAGASDLSALLAVNGNPRRFDPPPHGNTLSAQGTWEFSPSGRVLLFALRQRNAMGVEVDDPELSSTYSTARLSDIVVASLRDTVGRWRPFVALSTSGLARTDTQSVYRSASTLRSWQARAELGYEWSPRIAALAGVEAERLSADYETRTPVRGYDDLPGAPVVQSSLDRAGARDAGYAQIEGWPLPSLDVVAGARTDRSRFATDRTVDPRLSAAWHATSAVVFTASWGVYHQLADPAFIDLTSTREDLPALRADMAIAGAQIGTGARFARVEAWTKRYDDLVALTRDFRAVPGLAGNARGLDLFARSDGPAGTRLRLTWSVSRSRRTDPNTLLDAPAPYDVTNTITGVIERDWSNGWHLGFAQRFATGRPFTDVVSAAYDSTRGVFAPAFGPPNAGRLPDYRRADIAVSRARSLSGGRFLVIFGAIQNPFNSLNLYGYTWTRDYAERVPVRTSVNRTLFIGANLVQSKNP